MTILLGILLVIIIAGLASFAIGSLPMGVEYKKWAQIVLVVILIILLLGVLTGSVAIPALKI